MVLETHHGIRYLLNRELTEIYITHALKNFALSMVGIFIPIYLLESGLTLFHVFSFYIIFYFLELLFYMTGSRISARIGIKHSILLSIPLIILFFVSLYNLEALLQSFNMWFVIPSLSLVFSLAMFLYWFSFHVDFAKFSDSENEGKQVGLLQAVTTLFSVLGPLIGGIIITYLSFDYLFIFVSIVLFAGTIPLFMSEDMKTPKHKFSLSIFTSIDRHSKAIYIAEGARQVSALVMWPTLLYIISVQVSSMGVLYSITNLLLAVFSVFVGRLSDRFSRIHIMRVGAITHGLSLTLRSLFTSLIAIFSIQSIGAISFPLLNIPYSSIVYNKAREHGVSSFIIVRQSFFNIGRMIQMLIAMLLLFITGLPNIALMIPILIGSVCAIIMSFISE